jgi:phytoene synthase
VVAQSAYAACFRLARQHYENFPVASRLVPPRSRPHIAAVYAFARLADDFADEGHRSPAERLALLDDWHARLHDAARGRVPRDGSDAAEVFTALAETIAAHGLDVELFEDLLSAFRQDVVTTRYATWEDLLDYCRRSANPIGRLVLSLTGHRAAALGTRSDAVCTALQLTNFWQDLERDWARGRLYVPLSLVREAGAAEEDLDERRLSSAWRAALGVASARTRRLFVEGRAVADGVGGRLRWELRATWLGGMRILERLEAIQFDVFTKRPTLGWADAAAIVRGMATWR